MLKTYIVIPQYLVSDELTRLATTMIQTVRRTSDCIVVSVDDGGTQDSDKLEEMSDVYLKNDKNMGFAPTCNKGFKWVMENEPDDCYIICANNDIEVYKGWLEAMQEPFDMFENVAITGLISSRSRDMAGTPIEEFSIQKITSGGLLNDWMESGGLWMSKKSVLEKIGLFDEQFLIGGYEDVDIFLRARDTFGMHIIMSGKSCFWHKEGATRWESRFLQTNKRIETSNQVKFQEKWGYDPHQRNPWREQILWQP